MRYLLILLALCFGCGSSAAEPDATVADSAMVDVDVAEVDSVPDVPGDVQYEFDVVDYEPIEDAGE